MRRFRVEDAARPLEAFGSVGFHLSPLAKMCGDSQVVWVELDAGGCIARHAASGHQLLVVVRGQGEVSGETGAYESIAAGEGVLWSPGELHATRTADGLAAVIVEGDLWSVVRDA